MSNFFKGKTLVLPGVFNPLVAMSAKRVGFHALYLSGGALSASLGKPDIGLTTLAQVSEAAKHIVDATALPLLVDADTGFGNVFKTVRALEKTGAAGLHMEDQVDAKRCGHLKGKRLISTKLMCQKIRTACQARRKKDFVILARTDARGVEGLESAIERAKAYLQAGADGIFPEGLQSAAEFRTFAKALPKIPLLANMTEFGKTPYLTVSQFSKLGYKMVIFPVSTLRLAMKAVEKGLTEIRAKGTQKGILKNMQTRKELYQLLNYGGKV
ncbi:MAG: methylisocitrate lyase [Deltaproteobacteria bacterium]|nr:methylisocitrate lyase [Deltaproteobacteria bacterium]